MLRLAPDLPSATMRGSRPDSWKMLRLAPDLPSATIEDDLLLTIDVLRLAPDLPSATMYRHPSNLEISIIAKFGLEKNRLIRGQNDVNRSGFHCSAC